MDLQHCPQRIWIIIRSTYRGSYYLAVFAFNCLYFGLHM